MILSFINIRNVPREVLKTEGYIRKVPREKLKTEGFGFQHLPRDLANVNEWKIMFDPYNQILDYNKILQKAKLWRWLNFMTRGRIKIYKGNYK